MFAALENGLKLAYFLGAIKKNINKCQGITKGLKKLILRLE